MNDNIKDIIQKNAFNSNSSERFIIKANDYNFVLKGRADIFINSARPDLWSARPDSSSADYSSSKLTYIASVEEGEMFVFSKPIKTSRKGNKDLAEFDTERVDKKRDSVTEKDDLVNQIERQRQYIESIQGALSFLKD